MTLIAAFRCHEGVVLCADSQETAGDLRVAVNKLCPQDCGKYQLAIAGSGNGDLIDIFILSMEATVRTWSAGLDEASVKHLIRELLLDFHEREVSLYPADSAQHKLNHFLVCIKPKSTADIFLWRLEGSGIAAISETTLIGIEEAIYKHELARLYRPSLSVNQALLLGVHLFSLAKATSNYVGGPISIIFVGPKGMYPYAPADVAEMEAKVALFDQKIAELTLACPDLDTEESTLDKLLRDFQHSVKDVRRHWEKERLARAAKLQSTPEELALHTSQTVEANRIVNDWMSNNKWSTDEERRELQHKVNEIIAQRSGKEKRDESS